MWFGRLSLPSPWVLCPRWAFALGVHGVLSLWVAAAAAAAAVAAPSLCAVYLGAVQIKVHTHTHTNGRNLRSFATLQLNLLMQIKRWPLSNKSTQRTNRRCGRMTLKGRVFSCLLLISVCSSSHKGVFFFVFEAHKLNVNCSWIVHLEIPALL